MENDVLSWLNKNMRNWPYLPIYLSIFLVLVYILATDPISPNHEWITKTRDIVLAYSPVYLKYAEYLVFGSGLIALLIFALSTALDIEKKIEIITTLKQVAFWLFVFDAALSCIYIGLYLFSYKASASTPFFGAFTILLFTLLTFCYGIIVLVHIHEELNIR